MPAPEDYVIARPASKFLSEGEKRILIEMKTIEGADLCEMFQSYEKLVDRVCRCIEGNSSFKASDPESFINVCLKVIKDEIGIGNTEKGFLTESLKTNKFDCDNSSFLVFDVAKKLGIETPPEIVILSDHALLRIGERFYETTAGFSYLAAEFARNIPGKTLKFQETQG